MSVQFINNLGGSSAENAYHHSHFHGEHGGDHGHTHEHMDNPGACMSAKPSKLIHIRSQAGTQSATFPITVLGTLKSVASPSASEGENS